MLRRAALGAVLVGGCTDEGHAVIDSETDASTTSALDLGSSSSGESDGGPALPPRASEQHCRFDGWAPSLLAPVELAIAFDPSVAGATSLAVDEDTGMVWVGTDDGRVVALSIDDPAAAPTTIFAEQAAIVGLAVRGGHAFLRRHDTSPALVVDRYVLDATGVVDPASRVRVLRIPHLDGARMGAGLALDSVGNLVVPVGDGGIEGYVGPAEDRNDRRGKVLRLDVSALATDYDVEGAHDNPWSDEPSPADEVWALGVRDPSGCSIDEADGAIWCTDVGASASEVTRVDGASHLGWPSVDVEDCLLPGGECTQADLTAPDGSYRHAEDECGAVGGVVVRDGDLLDGVVVYGDRCSGAIWAADEDRSALVGRWAAPPVAFANDVGGTAWAVDADGRIGRVQVVPNDGEFPRALSQSGCFDDVQTLAAAPDLVPYELVSPLWTDGAHKQRHFVLPVGERIGVDEQGALSFPTGTVILKTFSFDFGEVGVLPVETRVMIRRAFGWEFHTYAWDREGRDAELLEDGAQIELALPEGPLQYEFPSRAECGYCHGPSSAEPLGPRLDQLARDVDYGHTVADQLEALEAIDLFDAPLPDVTPMVAPTDDEAPLESRARAWLHANCGHCHRPGGWAPPDLAMDLRWETPTEATNLCAPTQYYNPWFPLDDRVLPGDPDASAVWRRLSARGLGQMPPLATYAVDPDADVVREWIASLSECP